ncbi:MAG: DUF885 domain-containing protein [Acidobacteriaceae bacterium]|nr:DUF885 domain-containing protein [Acidobacteriaceae bacterium]
MYFRAVCVLILLLAPAYSFLGATQPSWVDRSNHNAELLLKIEARYFPEEASRRGVAGVDDQISIPAIDRPERIRHDRDEALKELRARLAAERDPLVREDLEILIGAGERQNRSSRAEEKFLLPYANAGETVYEGLSGLLQDQVAAERRAAALVRLRKYAGVAPGYEPATVLMENVFRERLKTPGLIGPPRVEVEKDLAQMDSYVNGIGLLFEKYKMSGYEEPYAKLKGQLAEYQAFVRTEVLPRARMDFRMPPELYAVDLDRYGVDFAPAELIRIGHEGFQQIQAEMQTVAVKVAKERNLPSSDYRDVIRALKKEQLAADEVMPVYNQTLSNIEAIIRREHLVTLPDRPAIIRLATAAETAQQPAPHMQPPPLINNHGERGQFVLPAGTVGANGKALKYDDFTFNAATWTLTAHEARPGHELQFDSMVERGVSLARAIYAFNSTNAEGWGLYAEWMMYPYMPDDAKLISLQLRLQRAAREFLDPELQEGKITPEAALKVLENDVVLSEAFATEEVDRFTFRMPGQAVSYYDGYTRLLEIRHDAEQALGPKFDAQKFHDFILSQGLLPPSLLRKAVMGEFVSSL